MPLATTALRVEVDRGRILIGRSAVMQRVWDVLQRAAPGDASVLITGETGTGKELAARLIHKLSPRAPKDFVAIDCSAVAPTLLESELFGHERGAFTGADRRRVGVFEQADGSTLFLDEISNLTLEAQAKLLRVLQEREFRRVGGRSVIQSDFRLISASNSDLEQRVRAGTFREDLLHRLKVVSVRLPSLRERREDIPLLVSHYLSSKRLRLKRPDVCRLSHDAVDALFAYDWPGNVRELENVIATAIVQCPGDTIEPAHFACSTSLVSQTVSTESLELGFRVARQHAIATFERLYLLGQLRRYRGRLKDAASNAGITTKHMRSLMKRHGVNRGDFRPPLRTRTHLPAKHDDK
jgi:two-component system response regulator AtoC